MDFKLDILDGYIQIAIFSKKYRIRLDTVGWDAQAFYKHWTHVCAEAEDHCGDFFMCLNMIPKGAQKDLHLLRLIRTTSFVHFDEVYVQSPWSYAATYEYENVEDYLWSSKDLNKGIVYNKYKRKLPEFTIPIEQFSNVLEEFNEKW